MFTWKCDESGEASATCTKCGRIYFMTSEWDRVNIEWHIHESEAV